MKKGIVLLLVVLLAFSMLALLANFFPAANATYVEGTITRDTVWMLVDSPFIVINNVTVPPGVTLTIEPGVEVKFGGKFSINVQGKLVAVGTEDRTITFTSNKHEGEAGDWVGINFSNVSDSSLSHCVVKYAVHGIIVESSSLTISYCEIIENLKSGIMIIGNSSLTVDNSKIMLNENGILPIDLNIKSSQHVTIRNTTISSNFLSGISINGSIWNLNIINCSIMSNQIGIYISGETNANITYNSIAYNEKGVLYDNTLYALPINYNDIYNNTLAMRSINSTISIDATHNYWGDKNGPYHPSLNPDGKGNPIESNGTDIDFIPFLAHSVRRINEPPVARLLSDKVTVAPNQKVLFIGTNSSDDGRVDYYLFDFGDGADSGWTTLSAITHKYSTNGNYIAKLTVLDDFGVKSNTVNVTINVQNLPVLDVSLTLSANTIDPLENVSVIVQVKSGGTPIENSSVRLLSVRGGHFTLKSGLTNATGYFVTTFIAPNVTKKTNIMLIVTASKDGYADGSEYKYVKILPPLVVDLEVKPKILLSEQAFSMNVSVTRLGRPISEAAVEVSSNLTGVFLDSGVTDPYGKCMFNFVAPAVKEKTSIAITVVASKEGYEDGIAQSVIVVEPRNMTVQITIYPETVFSDENSTIYVYVSYEQWPIEGAQVNIAANIGTLSSQIESTDSYGQATFVYHAPVVYEETTAILNITVSKDGYYDVTLQSAITIKPKVLNVEVKVYPETVFSEGTINVTAYVTFNGQPVSEVNIMVTSSFGNLSATGITNSNGICTFTFAAPAVYQQTNVTFFVNASKTGYVSGNSFMQITLKPGTLELDVNINPITANSGQTVVLTVHVKCNETDIQDVFVTVTSDFGNFSGYTNSSGLCIFEFVAPQVSAQTTFALAISASKSGYVDSHGTFYFDVTPTGASQTGFLSTTFLIIMAIILIIVVIIALLFKFRIIEVSMEEKAES